MATTTAFTPKSVTVGCEPNIYVNGYIYTAGPLALGSQCVAPTIELRNTMCSPVCVFYESRVELGMDTLANRQVVPPKGHCLITNLYPTLPGALSKIRVEDMVGNMECFVLEHNLEAGYDVFPLHHYEGEDAWHRPCPVLSLELQRPPYPAQLGGYSVPSRGNTIVVPLRLSCAPQAQPEPVEEYCESGRGAVRAGALPARKQNSERVVGRT